MSEIKFELLEEEIPKKLENLFEVYRKDSYNARVLYMSNPGSYLHSSHYTKRRVVYYDNGGGDWQLTHYERRFGIGVTNRMYSREKIVGSIIYKGGRFYYKSVKNLVQLTYSSLITFFWGLSKVNKEFITDKYPWMRFIGENDVLKVVSFNTFTKNKLYNLNDSLRYFFKCPLPVAKMLMEYYRGLGTNAGIKLWSQTSKSLINICNLRNEMLMHTMFGDTCTMAHKLGKKVNCSWSIKRLEAEHNAWSKTLTELVLEHEPLENLRVGEIYLRFSEYSGYRVFKTNKELLYEGMMQSHCVGTYVYQVNIGSCGIYHIDGYTLDLRRDYNNTSQLRISQFNGYRNRSAPLELYNMVNDIVSKFNAVHLLGDKSNVIEVGTPFMYDGIEQVNAFF